MLCPNVEEINPKMMICLLVHLHHQSLGPAVAKVYPRTPVKAWGEKVKQMAEGDLAVGKLRVLNQHKKKFIYIWGELGRIDAIIAAEILRQ